MSEKYKDLGITQGKDGDYWDVVIPDLDFETDYAIQAAWIYSDKTLGTSEFSDRLNFTTNPQAALASPEFISSNLSAVNSILYISWNGKDSNGATYSSSILKQVNVWIKGGDFGDEYKQYATSFTKAGTIQINATKKATYCVKLQAETKSGKFSLFSNSFCVTLLKEPKPVTNLQGRWVKDDLTSKTDTLMITFDFDAAYSDATNSNKDADYFLITLAANGKDRTFWFPVNKASINQSFFLSATDNKASFGLFASQFEVFILVRDKLGQVSTLVNAQTLTYSTPLDTPTITATAGTLSYSVSYNNQTGKPFDNIYIYEDTGSGYNQVAQGTSNPIVVPVNNTLQRSVKAKFYDSNGGSTAFSEAVTVKPLGVVTVDTDGPPNVDTPTTSGGLDPLGTIGFNGYANISWTAVTTGGIRGYRIRYRPITTPASSYAYVDSPGTGTSYRLTGLNAGVTYEIAVATYDEYNNTSTQFVSGASVAISGTPYISSTVDVSGYFSAKANASDADSTAFKFGYFDKELLGKRGISLTEHNYWYIDSNQGASLKVGGADNFISWNGSSLIVTGDLRAKKGSFSGNVNIATGASLYSGTLTGNTVNSAGDTGGTLSGAGYVLNTTGIKFNSATVTDITTINASTGKLSTALANIGGWEVDSTTISKNGITLNSSGKIIGNSGSYYVGIHPRSSAVTDIVLWAGQSSDGGTAASGANFRVSADGTLYATGAVISGNITLTNGSGLSNLINSKSNIYRSATQPTGTSYNTADLWVDTANANKVYQWSGSAWVVVQDSAAALSAAGEASGKADDATAAAGAATAAAGAATDAAGNAASAAADAAGKAQKFDKTSGNLILGLTLDNSNASIYSVKTSYTDTTNGWYLGWKSVGGAEYTPAIYLGGATTYLKYSTDLGLEIRGKMSASEITGGTIIGAGIYIGQTTGATDKILSTGQFSLGNGSLTYPGSGSIITVNASTFKFIGASELIDGDSNNYGGDSTVVLGPGGNLTKGRAFHYGGATVPTASNTSRMVKNSESGLFQSIPFVAGDIWMTVD